MTVWMLASSTFLNEQAASSIARDKEVSERVKKRSILQTLCTRTFFGCNQVELPLMIDEWVHEMQVSLNVLAIDTVPWYS
jgi:hypothetical protein